MKGIYMILFLMLSSSPCFLSQSAKKFYSSGDKFKEAGSFKDAIDSARKLQSK